MEIGIHWVPLFSFLRTAIHILFDYSVEKARKCYLPEAFCTHSHPHHFALARRIHVTMAVSVICLK